MSCTISLPIDNLSETVIGMRVLYLLTVTSKVCPLLQGKPKDTSSLSLAPKFRCGLLHEQFYGFIICSTKKS